jgi:serine phosphatase RsbU (regulator of sigma subunit)
MTGPMAPEAPTAGPGAMEPSRLPPVRILLVDDQPNNLVALEAILADLGQELVQARSGQEALRCLLKEDCALILLDVHMPGMNGFETAALIRGRKRSRGTPIIFLTAYEHTDLELFRGYSLGAVDYLVKPIVPDILRTKVRVFVEIFQKTEEVKRHAELVRQLEQREHARQMAAAQERWEAERLKQEIRIARQIQQRLFPAAPLPLAGYDIAGASYPAEATGGDYFDYIPLRDDGVGIVIGDVSGHGFGPALLMAETRAFLRAFALTRTAVDELLDLVNQALFEDVRHDYRFTTLMFVRLAPGRRSFVYVSAGHPAGYVLDSSGAIRVTLPSTAMPLGILPTAVFPAVGPLELEAGDLMLLLTDGILEARTSEGTLFGVNQALEVVRANRGRLAHEIVNILYDTVRDFCGRNHQVDDMTAIVVKALPT